MNQKAHNKMEEIDRICREEISGVDAESDAEPDAFVRACVEAIRSQKPMKSPYVIAFMNDIRDTDKYESILKLYVREYVNSTYNIVETDVESYFPNPRIDAFVREAKNRCLERHMLALTCPLLRSTFTQEAWAIVDKLILHSACLDDREHALADPRTFFGEIEPVLHILQKNHLLAQAIQVIGTEYARAYARRTMTVS